MPTFTNDKDATILVEFTSQNGIIPVADSEEDLIEKSEKAINSAMNKIHHMARRVNDAVDKIAKPPSEVAVSFGFKFDAEAGVLIAKAGMEASINVTLKWQSS